MQLFYEGHNMGEFVLGEESVSDEGSSVWNPIMA